MKSINDIKKEINLLTIQSSNRCCELKIIKSNKKKIEDLKVILLYLETNPKESSMNSQLNSLESKVKALWDRFEEWKKTSIEARKEKNPMTLYSKIHDIPRLVNQIETLKYILNITESYDTTSN